MNKHFFKYLLSFAFVFFSGLVPAVICQFFEKPSADRYIHMRSFRYGKDPAVIRCNRGDKLHLTFSTDDTGHSFFLEEFDIDAKVSPARNEVEVFKTSDPTQPSYSTRVLTIEARHPGILNYLISKSNYRCHVWCGPMHAFESGKLIILPNTLLVFSLGCMAGIWLLWIYGFRRRSSLVQDEKKLSGEKEVLRHAWVSKLITSRWPQLILMLFAMLMIYVVILTALFGTQMSGRNLGVLLMWAVWLFLLVAILTPFFGRIWCSICPLPMLGDFIQRRSFFTPIDGKTNGYRNKFYGLSLKWPQWLNNNWLKLFVFMVLATFSTTLVARPRVSGFAVLGLLIVPTIMACIWELRAFCRYVCPVSVFLGPFSRMSILALRSKSQPVCDRCKTHFCEQGSVKGWACPYGINVGEMKENSDCGLCLECTRSCLYNNVAFYKRPFAAETGTRNLSEAWMTLAIVTLAIVYSVLYEGHWPVIRDYVNILDKKNWDLFGLYALVMWTLTLVIVPGLVYLTAKLSGKWSHTGKNTKEIFLGISGSLLPMGLMLWIAFVIPMFFTNITFIVQSFSDPFGWGWDFFGTANIPWHQFLPRFIPWLQAVLVLYGYYLGLRNLKLTWVRFKEDNVRLLPATLPMAIVISAIAVGMIFFYTN